MNIPEFTAQASLYRTSNGYRSYGSDFGVSPPAQSVVAAQSGERFAECDACEKGCFKTYSICLASASAGYAIAAAGCVALVFPPAIGICEGVAAGVYAGAAATCLATAYGCLGFCHLPGQECCPVFCELGHCCSEGETCVPHGCCPRDQVVCDGKCCGAGESCCGDTCCPPNYYCRDGGFCSEFPSDLLPPPGTPPPPPPVNHCLLGGAPCGNKCCPPGLECCGLFNGQPDCKTSCLH